MIALCLSDLLVVQRDHPALALVLRPNLGRQTITIERDNFDHEAIAFTCPDERAEAILAIIRTRIPPYTLRAWRRVGSRWKKA